MAQIRARFILFGILQEHGGLREEAAQSWDWYNPQRSRTWGQTLGQRLQAQGRSVEGHRAGDRAFKDLQSGGLLNQKVRAFDEVTKGLWVLGGGPWDNDTSTVLEFAFKEKPEVVLVILGKWK